jgi:biopolymer transport protein ExbD
MSSMLDCVFILLIFFIVTTTFVDERGIEVERPTPSAGGDSPKPTVALVVDKAGNVIHEGRKVAVSAVGAIVQRAIAREDIPVVISAEREAPAGVVVQVMGEARAAGASKVNLASKNS